MARPKHHHRAVFFPNAAAAGAEGPDAYGQGLGSTQAWHKTNREHNPYCVTNELISAEIGSFLRLPIPPFAITYGADGTCFFSSLYFNFDREQLPPVDPEQAWAHLPELCAGVVVFDILIGNCDRHDENLVVDQVTGPRTMQVFDHDQALLGGGDPALRGRDRLTALQNGMGISGGDLTKGNRHCLLDVIDSADHFDEWFRRIDALPDFLIEDSCRKARDYGLSAAEEKATREFLTWRRRQIRQIVSDHAAEFTGIKSWPSDGRLFR